MLKKLGTKQIKADIMSEKIREYDKKLIFQLAQDQKSIRKILNFNMEVFSELPDVDWNVTGIKKELESGWELYSVKAEDQIVAALFLRLKEKAVQTKHTAIKIDHQGNAYSHQIRDFVENKARETGLSTLINFCAVDDFRMISLNETHGYKKTSRVLKNGEFSEWEKKISKIKKRK